MDRKNKPDVYDARSELNTIGQEIYSIAQIHQKDIGTLETLITKGPIQERIKFNRSEIKKIAEYFGIYELELFIKTFQDNYKDTCNRCQLEYKKSKVEIRAFKEALSYIEEVSNSTIDKLNDILDYFNQDSIEEVIESNKANYSLFKSTKSNNIHEVNLSVILRKGIILYESKKPPNYNEERLINWINKKEWINHLEDPNYIKSLTDVFHKLGITLLLSPYLHNTVFGLVHWYNNSPIVIITDRGHDLASCWNTLFHEIGHVINDKGSSVFDNEDCTSVGKRRLAVIEKKANDFANAHLLNGNDLRKIVFANKKKKPIITYNEIVDKYQIHEVFAKYWLRKASIQPSKNQAIYITFKD